MNLLEMGLGAGSLVMGPPAAESPSVLAESAPPARRSASASSKFFVVLSAAVAT